MLAATHLAELPVRALLAAAAACSVVDARSGDVWPYTGAGRSVTMSGGEVRGMAYKLRWTIAMTILGLAPASALIVVTDSIRWGAWLGTLAPAWS